MLAPPQNLVLEVPGRTAGCPAGCRHCLHRGLEPSAAPDLDEGEIHRLLDEGRALGIAHLSCHPHEGDLCWQPMGDLFRRAAGLGYRVKTVTNGAVPEAVEAVLPWLYRLAISVDSLAPEAYGHLRDPAFHPAMRETLRMLGTQRGRYPSLRIHALLVVSRYTLDTIEARVADLVAMDLFHKIKLLELLPVGAGTDVADETLVSADDLARLAALRARYAGRVRIGTPLWRVEADGVRGCRLGAKDLVVGPQGQVAGCMLLLYANRILGNVREARNLEEIWRGWFEVFRERARRPVGSRCRACALYARDLCWGGCAARAILFGREREIARSCGVTDAASSQRLLARIEQGLGVHSSQVVLPAPGDCDADAGERPEPCDGPRPPTEVLPAG